MKCTKIKEKKSDTFFYNNLGDTWECARPLRIPISSGKWVTIRFDLLKKNRKQKGIQNIIKINPRETVFDTLDSFLLSFIV